MSRGSSPGERRGGRKRGTPNKRTQELREAMSAAAKQIEEVIAGAFEGDAHTLLIAIYKDVSRPIELRIEAAKAAIAYEKPKLAAIAVEHSGTVSHDDAILEIERIVNERRERERPN